MPRLNASQHGSLEDRSHSFAAENHHVHKKATRKSRSDTDFVRDDGLGDETDGYSVGYLSPWQVALLLQFDPRWAPIVSFAHHTRPAWHAEYSSLVPPHSLSSPLDNEKSERSAAGGVGQRGGGSVSSVAFAGVKGAEGGTKGQETAMLSQTNTASTRHVLAPINSSGATSRSNGEASLRTSALRVKGITGALGSSLKTAARTKGLSGTGGVISGVDPQVVAATGQSGGGGPTSPSQKKREKEKALDAAQARFLPSRARELATMRYYEAIYSHVSLPSSPSNTSSVSRQVEEATPSPSRTVRLSAAVGGARATATTTQARGVRSHQLNSADKVPAADSSPTTISTQQSHRLFHPPSLAGIAFLHNQLSSNSDRFFSFLNQKVSEKIKESLLHSNTMDPDTMESGSPDDDGNGGPYDNNNNTNDLRRANASRKGSSLQPTRRSKKGDVRPSGGGVYGTCCDDRDDRERTSFDDRRQSIFDACVLPNAIPLRSTVEGSIVTEPNLFVDSSSSASSSRAAASAASSFPTSPQNSMNARQQCINTERVRSAINALVWCAMPHDERGQLTKDTHLKEFFAPVFGTLCFDILGGGVVGVGGVAGEQRRAQSGRGGGGTGPRVGAEQTQTTEKLTPPPNNNSNATAKGDANDAFSRMMTPPTPEWLPQTLLEAAAKDWYHRTEGGRTLTLSREQFIETMIATLDGWCQTNRESEALELLTCFNRLIRWAAAHARRKAVETAAATTTTTTTGSSSFNGTSFVRNQNNNNNNNNNKSDDGNNRASTMAPAIQADSNARKGDGEIVFSAITASLGLRNIVIPPGEDVSNSMRGKVAGVSEEGGVHKSGVKEFGGAHRAPLPLAKQIQKAGGALHSSSTRTADGVPLTALTVPKEVAFHVAGSLAGFVASLVGGDVPLFDTKSGPSLGASFPHSSDKKSLIISKAKGGEGKGGRWRGTAEDHLASYKYTMMHGLEGDDAHSNTFTATMIIEDDVAAADDLNNDNEDGPRDSRRETPNSEWNSKRSMLLLERGGKHFRSPPSAKFIHGVDEAVGAAGEEIVDWSVANSDQHHLHVLLTSGSSSPASTCTHARGGKVKIETDGKGIDEMRHGGCLTSVSTATSDQQENALSSLSATENEEEADEENADYPLTRTLTSAGRSSTDEERSDGDALNDYNHHSSNRRKTREAALKHKNNSISNTEAYGDGGEEEDGEWDGGSSTKLRHTNSIVGEDAFVNDDNINNSARTAGHASHATRTRHSLSSAAIDQTAGLVITPRKLHTTTADELNDGAASMNQKEARGGDGKTAKQRRAVSALGDDAMSSLFPSPHAYEYVGATTRRHFHEDGRNRTKEVNDDETMMMSMSISINAPLPPPITASFSPPSLSATAQHGAFRPPTAPHRAKEKVRTEADALAGIIRDTQRFVPILKSLAANSSHTDHRLTLNGIDSYGANARSSAEFGDGGTIPHGGASRGHDRVRSRQRTTKLCDSSPTQRRRSANESMWSTYSAAGFRREDGDSDDSNATTSEGHTSSEHDRAVKDLFDKSPTQHRQGGRDLLAATESSNNTTAPISLAVSNVVDRYGDLSIVRAKRGRRHSRFVLGSSTATGNDMTLTTAMTGGGSNVNEDASLTMTFNTSPSIMRSTSSSSFFVAPRRSRSNLSRNRGGEHGIGSTSSHSQNLSAPLNSILQAWYAPPALMAKALRAWHQAIDSGNSSTIKKALTEGSTRGALSVEEETPTQPPSLTGLTVDSLLSSCPSPSKKRTDASTCHTVTRRRGHTEPLANCDPTDTNRREEATAVEIRAVQEETKVKPRRNDDTTTHSGAKQQHQHQPEPPGSGDERCHGINSIPTDVMSRRRSTIPVVRCLREMGRQAEAATLISERGKEDASAEGPGLEGASHSSSQSTMGPNDGHTNQRHELLSAKRAAFPMAYPPVRASADESVFVRWFAFPVDEWFSGNGGEGTSAGDGGEGSGAAWANAMAGVLKILGEEKASAASRSAQLGNHFELSSEDLYKYYLDRFTNPYSPRRGGGDSGEALAASTSTNTSVFASAQCPSVYVLSEASCANATYSYWGVGTDGSGDAGRRLVADARCVRPFTCGTPTSAQQHTHGVDDTKDMPHQLTLDMTSLTGAVGVQSDPMLLPSFASIPSGERLMLLAVVNPSSLWFEYSNEQMSGWRPIGAARDLPKRFVEGDDHNLLATGGKGLDYSQSLAPRSSSSDLSSGADNGEAWETNSSGRPRSVEGRNRSVRPNSNTRSGSSEARQRSGKRRSLAYSPSLRSRGAFNASPVGTRRTALGTVRDRRRLVDVEASLARQEAMSKHRVTVKGGARIVAALQSQCGLEVLRSVLTGALSRQDAGFLGSAVSYPISGYGRAGEELLKRPSTSLSSGVVSALAQKASPRVGDEITISEIPRSSTPPIAASNGSPRLPPHLRSQAQGELTPRSSALHMQGQYSTVSDNNVARNETTPVAHRGTMSGAYTGQGNRRRIAGQGVRRRRLSVSGFALPEGIRLHGVPPTRTQHTLQIAIEANGDERSSSRGGRGKGGKGRAARLASTSASSMPPLNAMSTAGVITSNSTSHANGVIARTYSSGAGSADGTTSDGPPSPSSPGLGLGAWPPLHPLSPSHSATIGTPRLHTAGTSAVCGPTTGMRVPQLTLFSRVNTSDGISHNSAAATTLRQASGVTSKILTEEARRFKLSGSDRTHSRYDEERNIATFIAHKLIPDLITEEQSERYHMSTITTMPVRGTVLFIARVDSAALVARGDAFVMAPLSEVSKAKEKEVATGNARHGTHTIGIEVATSSPRDQMFEVIQRTESSIAGQATHLCSSMLAPRGAGDMLARSMSRASSPPQSARPATVSDMKASRNQSPSSHPLNSNIRGGLHSRQGLDARLSHVVHRLERVGKPVPDHLRLPSAPEAELVLLTDPSSGRNNLVSPEGILRQITAAIVYSCGTAFQPNSFEVLLKVPLESIAEGLGATESLSGRTFLPRGGMRTGSVHGLGSSVVLDDFHSPAPTGRTPASSNLDVGSGTRYSVLVPFSKGKRTQPTIADNLSQSQEVSDLGFLKCDKPEVRISLQPPKKVPTPNLSNSNVPFLAGASPSLPPSPFRFAIGGAEFGLEKNPRGDGKVQRDNGAFAVTSEPTVSLNIIGSQDTADTCTATTVNSAVPERRTCTVANLSSSDISSSLLLHPDNAGCAQPSYLNHSLPSTAPYTAIDEHNIPTGRNNLAMASGNLRTSHEHSVADAEEHRVNERYVVPTAEESRMRRAVARLERSREVLTANQHPSQKDPIREWRRAASQQAARGAVVNRSLLPSVDNPRPREAARGSGWSFAPNRSGK